MASRRAMPDRAGARPMRVNLRRGARGPERLLSRRDRLIVARHEVPGVMRKIAPSQRDD